MIRLVIFEAFLAAVFRTSTLAACNLDFPTAQMFIAVVALGLSYFSYHTLFFMCLPMCSLAFFAAIIVKVSFLQLVHFSPPTTGIKFIVIKRNIGFFLA